MALGPRGHRPRPRAGQPPAFRYKKTGEVKELLVILKADVQGSVEVLKDTLTKLTRPRRSKYASSARRRRDQHMTDVLLASASNATETAAATVIIGFNVRPETPKADDDG